MHVKRRALQEFGVEYLALCCVNVETEFILQQGTLTASLFPASC